MPPELMAPGVISSPRAILFDLDDTLISAYGQPELAWQAIVGEFATALQAIPEPAVTDAIAVASEHYWSDAERHRLGRLNLVDARTGFVMDAFRALSRAGHPELPAALAQELAGRYATFRDEQMYLFSGAHDLVDTLKARGVKLALVTNGTGPAQRAKIDRFELAHRFDHIQIEGEHGFGKPDERAYLHAMSVLGVAARETWMVGDHLEWEIAAPQRLGIYAIWHDAVGKGLPPGSPIKPDRVIRSLAELMPAG